MDRRRSSLALLLLFVACTGVAIVVGGSRPALQQGIAPTVAQFAGYLCALGAAALLLAAPREDSALRRGGATVLGAVLVLVLVELVSAGGPDIGAGGVRLIALVVLVVASVRLAQGVAATGRSR